MTKDETNRILKRHADAGDDNARVLLALRTGDRKTLEAHRTAILRLKASK